MSLTRIRMDTHGPYIKVQGHLFRPFPTPATAQVEGLAQGTRFRLKQVVCLSDYYKYVIRVGCGNYSEFWALHGLFDKDSSMVDTDTFWHPLEKIANRLPFFA